MRKLSGPSQLSSQRYRFRVSLAEIFYNACIASGGFRTVLLQTLGMNAGGVGLVSSLCSAANIIAPPVWGTVADRMRSYSKCFILCLLISGVLMVLVPVAAAASAGSVLTLITILLVTDSMFSSPANNMSELWLVQINDSNMGISYGSVRLWASVGYAVMGAVYTYLLAGHSVYIAYIMYGIFALPAILLALSLCNVPLSAEMKAEGRLRLRDLPFRKILCPVIIAFAAFTCIQSAAESGKVTFFIYILNDYGFGSEYLGVFMAVSAFCEVPTLLLSKRVLKKTGLLGCMMICLVLKLFESLLYVCGNSLLFIIIGQVTKGLCAGLLLSSRIQYLYHIAPKGLAATTNTLISSVSSVFSIVIMSFSGFLMESIGVRSFYMLIGAAEAISFVLLLVTRRISEKTDVQTVEK